MNPSGRQLTVNHEPLPFPRVRPANNNPPQFRISGDIANIEDEANASENSEEKYRILAENSFHGMAILQASRFIFCNSTFATMSGYSVSELLSLSRYAIDAMIHPKDRTPLWHRYRTWPAAKPQISSQECQVVKKDGAVIWLGLQSGAIEYNEKPALQLVFMDITEHKKMAESLQRALDWQKAVFEGSRDAIIISDTDSRIIDVNAQVCYLTGYSREELLAMEVTDFYSSLDPFMLKTLHKRIFSGEDILEETRILTKDGRTIDIEFGHRRVIISGKPYVHSVARDVSSRKRLEAQLLQAQKMEAVGSLTSGVAHDLNNMLNVINGYSELLLGGLVRENITYPDIEQIRKAGQRAVSLVAQLLAFSRKQILHPEILDLDNAIAEMSKMLRRLISENIDIVSVSRSNLGLVSADSTQIQQIIMNLAINARDAMPKGGKLTIKTGNINFKDPIRNSVVDKPGPYVMLTVSDNGQGMDETTQARIFEPFFTTKCQGKGTGLGLSTVYGIVKQSNGFISVNSEPGKGTTFKIFLPRVKGKISKQNGEDRFDDGLTESATVLLVEDEALVRNLIARILREQGYTVIEAGDGREGLCIAQEHIGGIHLVLTDVVMPGMGGRELVSKLKSIRSNIKALYISGYADETIVRDGILDTNISFLQKPFTRDSLSRKVREMLNS